MDCSSSLAVSSTSSEQTHHLAACPIIRNHLFDPHTMAEIHEALITKAGVYADAGMLGNVKGYTGEEVTSVDLHEPLPDDPTIPGWDIPHDGQLWQIKVGSTAFQRATDALDKNPDFPIISDPETAAHLQADGHEAMGLGNLDNEHLTSITEQTTVSIDDLFHLAPEVPVFSAMLIGYTQIRRHISGEITMAEAVTNVTIHVGSRSAAIFILTTTAVGIAAAAGTLPFAGPFVAGAAIMGSLAGREIAERIIAIRLPKSAASNLTDMLRRNQQQTLQAPGVA